MTDTPAGANSEADPPPDALSYGEALDELEDLLDELEGADVDVDLLAERVARGVMLVRHCRSRLAVVADDVNEVVAELVSIDANAGAGGKRAEPDEDQA